MKREILTNYSVAVNWLGNHRILCNNIPNIDPAIWDYFQFPPAEEEEDGEDEDPTECPECGSENIDWWTGGWYCNQCDYEWKTKTDKNEDNEIPEIFQWFITDATGDDVDFLSKNFGLIFTFSPLLDKYILCVDYYGTAWDYVECYTSLPSAERKLGEKK